MKRFRVLLLLTAGFFLGGMSGRTAAEEKSDGSEQFPAPRQNAAPQTPGERAAITDGNTLPDASLKSEVILNKGRLLTLDECIEIAVQSNLGLKLSRLNDRAADIRVREAWSSYYPDFEMGINHSNSRAVGEDDPGGSTSFRGGISQRSPWGTTLRFAVDESRTRFNTGTASGGFNVSVSQPLWKGAGLDVGMEAIRSSRIARLSSRGNLELDTQQLIFSVREAYANIISTIQNRDVNLQSIRSSNTFLDLTGARFKAGQVTQLEVFNAEVQLRGRELDLISTERELENAFDALKQLMDVDLNYVIRVDAPGVDFGEKSEPQTVKELRSDETAGTVSLVTTRDGKVVGEPRVLFHSTRYDESVILQEALDNRIELLNSRRGLAIQKLQTMLARDGLGHQIDLGGSVGRGHNGRSIVESANGNEVTSWSVGVNATFPWGKIRDRASYERALLALQTAEISLKRVRTNVQGEVRDIMRALREREKSLLIEGRRVEQSKRSVEAAQISFDRGLKDSFDVIRAEDELLRAKTTFINRTLNYVVLLARLELVVGKPTGRIELNGQSAGGLVDFKLPESLLVNGMPDPQPEPESKAEDDPLNNSREYRKDYKPKKNSPIIIEE